MAETLIELQDIYKIYQMGDTEVRALDGVSRATRRLFWPTSQPARWTATPAARF